jgi:hypothetical protein
MNRIKKLFYKLAISGIILYLLAIRFCDVSVGIPLGQHPLETGWESTGLIMKDVAMESWGKVSDQYESHKEMLHRLKEMQRDLGFDMINRPVIGGDKSFRFVNAEGVLNDGSQVIITIQTMNDNGKSETHLGFNLHHSGIFTGLDERANFYQRTMQRAGVATPLTVAIMGEVQGRLEGYAVEKIFSRFFRGVEAVRVDGGFGETYDKWRGRTRLLPGGVNWQGENVNVESSAAYDPSRNVTVITLATPGITEGL